MSLYLIKRLNGPEMRKESSDSKWEKWRKKERGWGKERDGDSGKKMEYKNTTFALLKIQQESNKRQNIKHGR